MLKTPILPITDKKALEDISNYLNSRLVYYSQRRKNKEKETGSNILTPFEEGEITAMLNIANYLIFSNKFNN